MAKNKKEEKSKGKLRSREKQIIKHNGIPTKMMDYSGIDKFCFNCDSLLPKQGMVVKHNSNLYCGFGCSDK